MTVSWRREDYGYAAAAAVGLAFVLYLVLGNFGLVPSPIAGPDASTERFFIQNVVLPSSAAEEAPVVGSVAVPATDPGKPVSPPAPVPVDRTAPFASITTQSGTSVALTVAAVVEGTADDEGSGVDEVVVTFVSSSGTKRTLPATVTCPDGESTGCTWRVKVPATLGDYTVRAYVKDKAGNGAHTETIELTVVNTGGIVQPLVDTILRVPEALGKVVGGLLNVLNGLT